MASERQGAVNPPATPCCDPAAIGNRGRGGIAGCRGWCLGRAGLRVLCPRRQPRLWGGLDLEGALRPDENFSGYSTDRTDFAARRPGGSPPAPRRCIVIRIASACAPP